LKTKFLLTVAAMCASSASLAADVSPTINPLAEATKIMDRCAGIANRISSMKVPPGAAEARLAELHNEGVAKMQATAAPGVKSKEAAPEVKRIAPEHQAFMSGIRAERGQLEKCGQEYARVNKPAEALMKRTGEAFEKNPTKSPSEDDKKVGAAMMAYSKASENLATSITALSKDSVHQRYVGRVVNKYFLGRE